MPGTPPTPPRHTPESFAAECARTLKALRASLRRLLAEAPTPIKRATDLQHALGVRASLAWQVFRVAKAEDASASVEHIPLADAMTKFFDAARKKGFPKHVVDHAVASYATFEAMIAQHAGSRSTLDAMIAGMGGQNNEQIDLRARRAAFRAASQLWGLQSTLTYRCLIGGLAGPGLDMLSVIVQGSRGLRALRPNRALPICRRTTTWTRADNPEEFQAGVKGTSLLEDFCTDNLPRITTTVRGSVAHDYVTFVGMGLTAKLDIFLATKMNSVLDDSEPELGVTSMIRVPSEEFIADMLVPAGVLDPATVTVRTCGCTEDVSAAETALDEYLLAPPRPAMYLGTDLEALHDKSMPRCPEMLRFVLREIGQSRTPYDIFRCRVRFPTLHTCIALNALRFKPR